MRTTEKGLSISRRRFMALAASATAFTACGGSTEKDYDKTTGNTYGNPLGGKWVKSYCGSCIWVNCGTEVKVVDGVAVEVRGNKEHPSNKGTLCPRGAAQLMNLYNPYRVKTPLKRTNPLKGIDVDPGWMEISWEEAMSEVIEKCRQAQADNPAQFMIMFGFAANLHESPFTKLSYYMLNTPNYVMSCGPLCEVHHAPAMFNATFVDRIDLGRCNYLVAFGRNIGTSGMFASGPGRAMADAVDRGMKFISVDPHAGADVSKKGEWVPILPGTDTAMGMAMLHVLLHETGSGGGILYDAEGLKCRSNAPYLVNPDGDYMRREDLSAPVDATDLSKGYIKKPLIYDISDTTVKFFDDPTLNDPSLVYTGIVDGIAVSTAFNKLSESVAGTTPEWAQTITSVPAETIRRISKELSREACIGQTITIDGEVFPYRPACVTVGRGSANNIQGMRFYVLADIINLVLGAIGVPGSLLTAAGPKYNFEDGMMRENPIAYYTAAKEAAFSNHDYTGKQFYPLARFPVLGHAMQALLNRQKYHIGYDIKALYIYGSNPFMNDADADITAEALKTIPFIFTVAYHMDETAMFCDIVLPEHAHLERNQIRPIEETMAVGLDTIHLKGLNYKEPAVKPLYNTRQNCDIFLQLAEGMGHKDKVYYWYNLFNGLATPAGPTSAYYLDTAQTYTYREIMDIRLKAYTGGEKGIEWFAENGFFMKNMALKECYEYYLFRDKSNPSSKFRKGRLPVYNWRDFRAGQSLKNALTNSGIIEIPGWEGKMSDIYAEYLPVPAWRENHLTDTSSSFDMIAANWKISLRMLGLGGQDDNVWLNELIEKCEFDDHHIQINTATGIAKGLKNGDKIIVESQHGGKVEGYVKLTDMVHPNVVGFPGQGGRTCKSMNPISHKGVNYNKLLTYKEPKFMGDNGSISVSARVKIRKA